MKALLKLFLPYLAMCTIIPCVSVAKKAPPFLNIIDSNIKDVILRSDKDVIQRIAVTIDEDSLKKYGSGKYILKLEGNNTKSTLPQKDYLIAPEYIQIDSDQKIDSIYYFYLTVKPDSKRQDDLELILDLTLKKDSVVGEASKTISVKSQSSIKNYSYLVAVGTNFDLVEGLKPKNLYFGNNLFMKPLEEKGRWLAIGLNFYLYGNRAISTTDTSKRTYYEPFSIATPDDSIRYNKYNAVVKNAYTSDNLGAKISPLYLIYKINSSTQLYYAPHFEFIWRRMQRLSATYETETLGAVTYYMNEDLVKNNSLPTSAPLDETLSYSRYDWYVNPIGFMFIHENSVISFRVQASFGKLHTYIVNQPTMNTFEPVFNRDTPKMNLFVRAWITEPYTGISLSAEAANIGYKESTGSDPYQPFYTVTLSKAFHLRDLSGMFAPLISRN